MTYLLLSSDDAPAGGSSMSGRSHLPGEVSTANVEEDSEPIVKMAGAAGIDSRGSKSDQASLLGYFWSVESDQISTAKEDDLNFHPARRGLRPTWARIREAETQTRPGGLSLLFRSTQPGSMAGCTSEIRLPAADHQHRDENRREDQRLQ